MIVIEGTDGVGKTTLARKIVAASKGRLQYQHMGPPEKNMDHVQWYLDRLGPYVWDRFHLGEETYGRLGLSLAGTSAERRLVRTVLKNSKVITIIVFASNPEDIVLSPAKAELYRPEQIRSVNSLFRKLAAEKDYCDGYVDISRDGYPKDSWIEALEALDRS